MRRKWYSFIIIPFLLVYAWPNEALAMKNAEPTWEAETVYDLIVDRFNNNDFTNDQDVDIEDPYAYHGGDFQGIIDRLDYLKEMGFTSIILSPIFEKETYTSDEVTDFYQPDEHYGSLQKLKELVTKAHKQDMKILLDVRVPQVDPEILNVVSWWNDEVGIDGYRVNANLLKETTWTKLQTLMDEKGLIMLNDTSGEGNGSINYAYTDALRQAFAKPDESLVDANKILLESGQAAYTQATVLDNMQMQRFTRDMIHENEHPGPRWKLALTYLYTTPGVPIVYYGTEIALDGGEAPDNQKQMDFRTDKELIEYMGQIGRARQSLKSLTHGKIHFLYEKNGMTVYKREYQDETTVIAINHSSNTQTAKITSQLDESKELHGVLSDEIIRPKKDEFTIVLDRDQAQIYQLQPKTGLNIAYIAVMGIVYVAFFLFIYLIWKRSRKQTSN